MTETLTVQVDAFDYDTVASHLDAAYKNPPKYQFVDIVENNCVGFVKENAMSIGLPAPVAFGHDPDEYVQALIKAANEPHTITLKSGASYTGPLIRNQQNGRGVVTFQNGDKYETDFVQGVHIGTGKQTFTWANHDSYTGGFINSVPSGSGTYTWANGDSFVGTFVQGVANGSGTYKRKDGFVYQGDIANGHETGQGRMWWKNGQWFQGAVVNGVPNGFATCHWSNGFQYSGQWAGGLPNGPGKLWYPDGNKTVAGNFVNGQRPGWSAPSVTGYGGTVTLSIGGDGNGGVETSISN